MTTADRIKNRRIELGLTQLEVARRLGLTTKAAVSKVEQQGNNVTLKSVEKFAKALDCSKAYLMGWEDDVITMEINTSDTESESSERIKKIVELYSRLSEDDQHLIDDMLKSLASKK